MLRFTLLGSGSGGNALVVTSSRTKILIDNGFSLKQLRGRAAAVHENLDDIKGIFISHEHADHVNGVGPLARALRVPVFATSKTLECLPQIVGDLPCVEWFEAGDRIVVNGLTLTSFSVSHDAADPVGFIAQANGAQLGIASDLGHASHLVKVRLQGSHGLVLESNHCPDLLDKGPYPAALKQRIRGRHGHLSNAAMNSLLALLVHDDLQVVVLAHLSKENNRPELARDLAAKVLGEHSARLHVAHQDKPTPVFEIHA